MLLNFNANLRNVTTKLAPHFSWRFAVSFATNPTSMFNPEPENGDDKEKSKETTATKPCTTKTTTQQKSVNKIEDLKQTIQNSINVESPALLSQIKSANTLSDILNLMKLPDIPQESSLKLMTIIAEWMNSSNIDARHLQKDKNMTFLDNVEIKSKIRHSYLENSNFKELQQLSIPKMIQAVRQLADSRSRNVPLLRFYFTYITENSEQLMMGQCSLLLYCMCILNFADEALLKKICSDLCGQEFTRATTVNNTITSLRFLRYKDEEFINYFCERLHTINFTPEQLVNIMYTFAVLNCKSETVQQIIKHNKASIQEGELDVKTWIDYVWSLTLLGEMQQWHIENILHSSFIEKVEVAMDLSMQLKLLNINAVAKYILKDYKGPLINKDSKILSVRSYLQPKSKRLYSNLLTETLQNISNSTPCFQQNIDSRMGYFWDAVYYADSNLNPLDINKTSTESVDVHRIAIMIHDYSCYCRGITDLVGTCELQTKLTRAKGYKALNISYENFSVEDKLSKRIKYLTSCIDSAVRQSI